MQKRHSRAQRGVERRIGWNSTCEAQRHSEELTGTGVDGVEAASSFAPFMPIDEYVHRKGTVTGVHRFAEGIGRGQAHRITAGGDGDEAFVGVRRDGSEHRIDARPAVEDNEVHSICQRTEASHASATFGGRGSETVEATARGASGHEGESGADRRGYVGWRHAATAQILP